MDDKTLQELKGKVERAEALTKQMQTMDDVIASCNAEVGFLNMVMNYNQQNAINLITSGFMPREVFDAFKSAIKAQAVELRKDLEQQYKNLK